MVWLVWMRSHTPKQAELLQINKKNIMNHQNKTIETSISLNSILKGTSVFLAASALILGGFFIAYAVEPADIVSVDPVVVSGDFTPAIDTTLPRGSEAYLGRTTTYTGPVLGAETDSIKWRVTIDGPGALTDNIVDLDEVGFNDPDGDPVNSIGTYHYPFEIVGENLVATGSCDAADTHDNGCPALVGFSLDTDDVFTNADKIKFNSNAPIGSYAITYELVNTADGSVVGTQAAVTVEVTNEVTITVESPSVVDPSFAPTLGADIARGDTAYLGRNTVNTTGLELGTGDTIKWKVTITGPSTLSADDVDLDEVGWADLNGNSIVPYHYPLSGTGGVLEAMGSCDDPLPSGHEGNPCTTNVGFSVDANDDFINADSIKFNYGAPNGLYTIKYELVNGDVVLGTYQVSAVNVTDPASIASADPADVDEGFDPEIGETLTLGSYAYLGRTTTYAGPVLGADPDTIQWRVTIDGADDLTADMVDLDEVGFNDEGIVLGTYHYPFSVVDGNLVANGSCVDENDHICTIGTDAFSLDEDDIFTNADKVLFKPGAPNGSYTIKYELVNTNGGVVLGTHQVTVNVVNPSASIVSANPNTVDAGFTPEIGLTLTRGSEAYLGRTTNYTGPQIGLGEPETIKWEVTISHETDALTEGMVDLDEVGWKDQTDQNVETFHYPFAAQEDGSLVALGSCDENIDAVGHNNECAALIGFSLVAGDIFTNADKIVFDSSALGGEYTITYELVNTADGLVVGTHTVTVEVVNTEITITADAQSKTYGDADPALTSEITSGSLLEGDELAGSLSRVAGENVGDYAITSTLAHPNYTITFVSADLTINPRAITVAAVTDTKIYDGTTDSAGTPTITDGSLAFSDTAGFTQTYDDKNVGTGKMLTPDGVVNDENNGDNYDVTFFEDETGEITSASLTITADNKSKVYGTENPELTASYDGFVGDDDEGDLDTEVSLSTTANETSPVGTYEITASGATGANYDITLTSGTLTVTAAPIIVTANDQSKNYGDADPELTSQITSGSLVNGDEFTGLLSRDTGEDVGTYAITQGTLALSSNYALTFVPATLTINFNATIVLTEAGEWTLISAPTLLDGAPTVTDNDSGVVVLLVYRNGAFVVPSEGDDELINPLSAFYVKTTNAGKVGLKFATISSPTQVSRQLTEGWNLVGTNYPGLAVDEFSSILNTEQTAGMVTLYVPDTYNAGKDIGYNPWGSDANHDLNANLIDESEWGWNDLSEYDGYWVFMNVAKAFVKNL